MAAARDEHPFRIGFLIHDVSRLRRNVMDKALKPYGITRSQWWVLANMSRRKGEGMMQTELAKVMDIGKVALGGLVDRLEAGGLVKREADRSDRRAKRVVMTAKGIRMLSNIQAVAAEFNAQVMTDIACSDLRCAEEVLHRMKKQLIAMDAVPGAGAARIQELTE